MYGVCDFVVFSVVEICVDYGGVYVFLVCFDLCVVYGIVVCIDVCGVFCVVECYLFIASLLCCDVVWCVWGGGCFL